jgi:hypothetical protein
MISKFDQYIKESTEFKQKFLRKLNAYEKYMISKFIDFLSIVKKYTTKDAKKTTENFFKFKSELEPYLKYDFSKKIKRYLKSGEEAIEYQNKNQDNVKKDLPKFMQEHDEIVELIKNGQIDAAIEMNKDRFGFVEAYKEVAKGNDHYAEENMRNPYLKQSSIFSAGQNHLVNNFSEEDIDNMSENKDKYLNSWTYITLPKTQLDDYHYLVYFIQKLSDEHAIKRISGRDDVKNYIDYHYADNSQFQELKKIVDDYLHNNKKELIPQIMNLIEQLPLIKQANEKAKRTIGTLYRGVGWHDDEDSTIPSKEEIWQQEKASKYVATSRSEHAARNFEYMKGHLDRDRNSDVGAMIIYQPEPKDIMLDTEIFGSIFGETEVILNTQTVSEPKIRMSYK